MSEATTEAIQARTTVYETHGDWLEGRRKGLGSSDAAAIMGQSKWSTQWKVWAEKKGILDREPEDKHWKRMGKLFEDDIAELYHEETKREFVDLGDYAITQHREHPWMLATFDRLDRSVCEAGVAEIKMVMHWMDSEWKNGVPIYYQIQGQHQLAIAERDRITFCAFFLSHCEFVYFDLERNDRFIKELIKREKSFWEQYVEGDAEPPISAHKADTDAAKRLHCEGTRLMAPDSIWELDTALLKVKERQKPLEEERDLLENQLKAMMGEHDEAVNNSKIVYTFKANKNGTRTLRRANKDIEGEVI